MVLRTIMDRGDNYKYLNGKLKLNEFGEKDSPHPIYEEWLRTKQHALTFKYIISSNNILFSQLF